MALGSVQESVDTALQGFRDDLDATRKSMDAMREDFSASMDAMRKEFSEDLAAVRKEFSEDLEAVRKELSASLVATQRVVTVLAEKVEDLVAAQVSMKDDINKLRTKVEGLESTSGWERKVVWSLLVILVGALALIAQLALSPAPVTLRLPSSFEAPVPAVPQPSLPLASESPEPSTQLPEPK